jgi:hypothetical protein
VHARLEEERRKTEDKASPAIGELLNVRITKATAWSLQGQVAATVAA